MEILIAKVLALYKLQPSVRYISKVRKGYLTSNFIIGNHKRKYFLKQYNDEKGRIKNTHKAKQLFSQRGIPVIKPYKTIYGKTYFCLNNKCYALFPYVESRQFRRLGLNKKALKSVGALLAKIHLITRSNGAGIDLIKRNFIWNNNDRLKQLDKILNTISAKKKRSMVDGSALELITIKKKIIMNNRCKPQKFNLGKEHIIHGDFHEANIFFKRNNAVQYIFDWECVSYAPRTIEIARTLSLMCFNGKFTDKNYLNASIFIKSYNDTYPVLKKELTDAIKVEYLMKAYSMWVLDEYYIKNNKKVHRFMDDELKTLRYLSKYFKKHNNSIMNFDNVSSEKLNISSALT